MPTKNSDAQPAVERLVGVIIERLVEHLVGVIIGKNRYLPELT